MSKTNKTYKTHTNKFKIKNKFTTNNRQLTDNKHIYKQKQIERPNLFLYIETPNNKQITYKKTLKAQICFLTW